MRFLRSPTCTRASARAAVPDEGSGSDWLWHASDAWCHTCGPASRSRARVHAHLIHPLLTRMCAVHTHVYQTHSHARALLRVPYRTRERTIRSDLVDGATAMGQSVNFLVRAPCASRLCTRHHMRVTNEIPAWQVMGASGGRWRLPRGT